MEESQNAEEIRSKWPSDAGPPHKLRQKPEYGIPRGWIKAPWGRHRILTTNLRQSQQKKILEINPDEMISLQSHQHRAEQWVILQGTGELTVGNEKRIIFPKETVWFPAGTKHRIHNGNLYSIMVILEIQTGTSFDENDITRYEDKYGRVTEK